MVAEFFEGALMRNFPSGFGADVAEVDSDSDRGRH